MPKDILGPIIVRYAGLFDLDTLYSSIIDWAKNYGYMWHEKSYKHKIPSVLGAEQELDWELSKNVTEYIKYVIKIRLLLTEMTELEVNTGGKTKQLTSGRLYLTMNGVVEWDWQKRFEKGGRLGKWLGKMYERATQKELESIYMDTLWYRMWNLQGMIKKILDLQTKKHAFKEYLGES
ncbi:hypothetical protein COV20_02630 [Candidatus Woesearchaeota archaeon CG10_big_fil_rev_8_21_14_0_10_45_16]|nr:MAG: hypothetical protein COV20_02630 [Candidatus Woesearchaeota archaeon CG10_big_fil_rev_8_21_14_0_10_45_16]